MRIAVISTSTFSSPPLAYGGEVFFWQLARGFHELGHHVTLYGAPGSLPPDPDCRQCRLRYIPGTYGELDQDREWAVVDWYYDEIMAHDFILDCAHGHPVAEVNGWYHRERQLKTLVVLNGPTSNTPRCGPYNVIVGSQKWKELLIYGRTQFYGMPYHNLMEEAIEPVPEKDIAGVVPWATDCNFYTPGDAPREPWFLWLSRPTRYKGLAVALDIAARQKLWLRVVPGFGVPAHEAEFNEHVPLIKEAIKRGAMVDVVFLPKNSQHHILKRELYRKARALLYPIQSMEPFGLVVVEALASGCPIITADLGAMPEIIKHGSTGFLCHDVAELEAAVGRVDKLSPDACRADAVARWHYLRAARQYLDIMEGKR